MGKSENSPMESSPNDEAYRLLQLGLAARQAIDPTDPTSLDDAEMYLGLLDGATADDEDSDPLI